MADLKIDIDASFPGEGLVVALIEAWSRGRENMDASIVKRWDVIGIEAAEYAWNELKKLKKIGTPT